MKDPSKSTTKLTNALVQQASSMVDDDAESFDRAYSSWGERVREAFPDEKLSTLYDNEKQIVAYASGLRVGLEASSEFLSSSLRFCLTVFFVLLQ